MKKSDSQLSAERLGAENAVLLLEVVESILRRIDPAPAATEPDQGRPVQLAYAHVRLAMGCLTAALTGEEAGPPSSLFLYLARVFGEQFALCRKHEDEDRGESNGNPPTASVH